MENDLLQFHVHSFMIMTTVNIIALVIGSWILKKYLKRMPSQYIPIITLFTAIIIAGIWLYKGDVTLPDHPWFYLFIGIMNGLCATGVYSFYKQIKQIIQWNKDKKYLQNDRRKRKRVIS